MYKKITKVGSTSIRINKSVEGETIEDKIERATNNKEPLEGDRPLIYTERKDGVMAGMDIRTDRFEVALEATSIVEKSYKARRENKNNIDVKDDKKDGKAEPTEGTENQ